jgi:hypothetical protein
LSTGAFAAKAQHIPITDFNPAIPGPPPPGTNIPSNCPSFLSTDAWNINFVSGNAVAYGTENKNGDWGGGNAEGTAQFVTSDGTVQYTGQLHVWFGGGNNKGGQSENGFTANFKGSGIAGTLSINAHQHGTTNNHGIPTANIFGANVSCS